MSENLKGHLIVLLVIVIWGTTFVSTKTLISCGLTPQDIFLIRFVISYLLIWIISPRKLFCNSLRDELCMVVLGISGGSLYFLAENYALKYTYCSNVALICSCAPLATSIIMSLFYKSERMNAKQWAGSAIALVGMTAVVLNGNFVLHLSPIGDLLALAAALTWGLYSLTIHSLRGKYGTTFINRKLFFYGVVTILPVYAFSPTAISPNMLLDAKIVGNVLFLSVIASMLCYIAWNKALYCIGTVKATNYLYFLPIVTMITSYVILDEKITLLAAIGALLTLGGLFLAEKH
ncbi:MAG: DMT family transporter [Bacteroidaceae bacterium]|nr:DMT family transporter [Bacteroidaceae bacterium]